MLRELLLDAPLAESLRAHMDPGLDESRLVEIPVGLEPVEDRIDFDAGTLRFVFIRKSARVRRGFASLGLAITRDAQQLNSDVGGLRSFHPEVKEKAGRMPLSQIKVLNSDPAQLDPDVIKKKYEEYFGT